MTKISASEQVQTWLIRLPPATKHKVRLALRKLGNGKGDIKALSGPLEGFNRLRIGSLRVIYRQTGRQDFFLEYANSRDRVYEVFQQVARAITERSGK
jgi:mRNA-degrading endonuclease RelE of RelBE toxin-antitoxin system